jgi:hypothetical protein
MGTGAERRYQQIREMRLALHVAQPRAFGDY